MIYSDKALKAAAFHMSAICRNSQGKPKITLVGTKGRERTKRSSAFPRWRSHKHPLIKRVLLHAKCAVASCIKEQPE